MLRIQRVSLQTAGTGPNMNVIALFCDGRLVGRELLGDGEKIVERTERKQFRN